MPVIPSPRSASLMEMIHTVSKLLGHKRLETTEIYAKVIDQKKRQAVGMLPRLNGGWP